MASAELIDRPAHVSPDRFWITTFMRHSSMARIFMNREGAAGSRCQMCIWTPRNGGHWMVLRGKLVSRVLSDYENFSNHTVLVPKDTAGEAYRLLPLSLDPPAHAPFRNLLSAGLFATGR